MTDIERRQYIEEWKSSVSSMAAFCRIKGLKYPTFRLWLEKFDGNEVVDDSNNPSLVKLKIPPVIRPAFIREHFLGIHFDSYDITVLSGYDNSDLTRVLSALKNLGN